MGLYIDQGNELFRQTVVDEIYVDKTRLLADLNRMINTARRFVCVTRPRRFGKSIAAQMLCAYYDRSSHSRDLFESLDIGHDATFETHLNKYAVLSFDVQEQRSRVERGIDFVPYLQKRIGAEMRKIWPSATSDCTTIQEMMASIREVTGLQFVICLDEWHAIYRMDEDDDEAQKMWIDFLRAIVKGTNAKNYIALAYMTGVLPIRNYASESPLNNFYEYNVFDSSPFETYYGFTEDEVRNLCSKYDMNFEMMKHWYDGYEYEQTFFENSRRFNRTISIYNPNSVIRSIFSGKYSCYWNDTGSLEPVERYIQLDIEGVRSSIVRMIAGEWCEFEQVFFNKTFNNLTSFSAVMTMLAHLGYITYDSKLGRGRIPNEEIRKAMALAAQSCRWDEVSKSIFHSKRFIDAIIAGNAPQVAETLSHIHSDIASILTYNDENALACTVMYACYTARKDYFIFRELPSGVGFVDIALIPLPHRGLPAILIELKWNKDADAAITQIHHRRYTSAFDGFEGDIIIVGVSYDKNSADKMHNCKIERIVK